MKDDLFERLRSVNPASDERILHEARRLGDFPPSGTSGEATNVYRIPRAVRRRATLVAVAAIAVVAIALPLTLLRSIGEGGGSPGDDPGTWVAVDTLADLRDQGVTYVPQLNAFVVAPPDDDPYALWAASGDPLYVGGELRGPRALYCEAAARFADPYGNVFDQHGIHLAGPANEHGLGRFPVRVVDGTVEVDTSKITALGTSSAEVTTDDLGCLTATGIPLEGRPGFAIPAGTELPPIAVALPQSGMLVQSPITIAGSADVFEATVSIRVLDASGDVIAETSTMATCGTGCRGDFSTQFEVPIDGEQPGTIQVFEVSAKDGSMINLVEIPVTLVPSTG